MTFQRALAWSIFWIGLSLLVAVGIFYFYGSEPAEAFLTGYTLEKALSVDNLFVFLMIFTYFGVKREAQRRVLNFGMIGVLVLRGVMILAGIALVEEFAWILYILGAVVLYSGFVMVFGGEKEFDPKKSHTIKLVSKFIHVSHESHGTRFFFRDNGKLVATPLFLVVAVIEVTDVIFAVDSIPAILAVTRNPWLVFSSNMLAILGLRSLYFLLLRAHDAFRFVKHGVGVILWFIGAKMILPAFWPEFEISNTVALGVVIGILTVSVILSVAIRKPHDRNDPR